LGDTCRGPEKDKAEKEGGIGVYGVGGLITLAANVSISKPARIGGKGEKKGTIIGGRGGKQQK